jgi:hypothetical protein
LALIRLAVDDRIFVGQLNCRRFGHGLSSVQTVCTRAT